MHSSSIRSGAAQEYARRVDWGAVAVWALGFGLVVFVGLEGGGYDPLVHDRVGIAVWWILLAGVAVGVLPNRRLPRLAWVALALFAAFVLWTALSLIWTESSERTVADLARLAGYLGALALAVFAAGGPNGRRLVAAVGAGVAVVAVVALLSRLHPAWFPEAGQTARFLSSGRERLSYPLNYWNGLAALIAIGAPLLLQVATDARSIVARAAAAAVLPAIALAAFFTLSRSGIAAALVALALFLAFTSDRLPKLLTALLTGAGGTVLIALATHRDALQHARDNAVAHQQGDEMILLVVIVCLLVGLAQAGISLAFGEGRRPSWSIVPRSHALTTVAVAGLVALIAAVAFDAPGRASDGWSEFKGGEAPGRGAERLGSVAGESRYQFWGAAVRQNATDPLIGTGSGTFAYWWTREGDVPEIAQDTHSLYLQTLGEVGIVGLALLAAFLAAILIWGGRNVVRASSAERPYLAAALAGCTAFFLTAIFDWMWQIPVLALAMLLLAAVLVTARSEDGEGGGALPIPWRAAVAVTALIAIVAIAIPLASTSLLRQSEADARAGDLGAALQSARSAQNVEPGAASPRLQQALLLEAQGDFDAAAEAAQEAGDREPTNWRTWLVLFRIEAERGNAGAALRLYRKARALNPYSELFQR
ncbi:MAG: O-antigen ligase family protein [Solirubrobacterales bacterium]